MARRAALSLALLILPISLASAGDYRVVSTPVAVVGGAPVQKHYPQPVVRARRSSGGFFSNLMELERRKNAWLKRTFLGI